MSTIEWTQKTWNPLVGCSKISEGCQNCYAINQAHRNAAMGQQLPNPGRLAYYQGLTEARGSRIEWTGQVKLVPEALEIPLKTRKPTTWFVNSMSDFLHESVTFEWLFKMASVMLSTPQHTYQILTKRPERFPLWNSVLQTLQGSVNGSMVNPVQVNPLPNVWLGVTVENQKAANDRISLLLKTPAAVRFLSCEPLLEKIDFLEVSIKIVEDQISSGLGWDVEKLGAWEDYDCLNDLDWVIVGGESGHKARFCDITWMRSIVAQCKASGTLVFVKQLGTRNNWTTDKMGASTKGSNPDEWPEDLRVREMPKTETLAGV